MARLTDEQLTRLQKLLADRANFLRRDLRREVDGSDNFRQIGGDVPDSGDASYADLTVDLGNAQVARDVNELREIDAARQRMQDGTYGECVQCGNPIPYERQLAQPTAERCTPCQERYEKTHADAGRGGTL